MNLSDAGVAFIAAFEGFSAKPYNDPANHATIGFGHLIHTGPINGSEPEEFKNGITREQGLALLRQDARKAEDAVRQQVKVPLSQPQFDALVSFTFNVGAGALARSDLLKRLNRGEYGSVPQELKRWVYAGGRVFGGLQKRREQEGQLWEHGDYDPVRLVLPAPASIPVLPTTPGKVEWISQLNTNPDANAYTADCLSTCAAMIYRHHGTDVTPDEVTWVLGVPSHPNGFHINDVYRLPPAWGIQWKVVVGATWYQVKQELDANRQVMFYIEAGYLPPNWRYHGFAGDHYVVGTDLKQSAIHYLDPNWESEAQGRCWLPTTRFDPAWQRNRYQAVFMKKIG
jgi:lysozyme